MAIDLYGDGELVAAAADYSLITVARAQVLPGLADLTDAVLEPLIKAASRMLIRWCHRDFRALERTETYDGDGTRGLLLNVFPISSIDEDEAVIVSCGDTVTDTYDDSYFAFDPNVGELRFKPTMSGWFTKGFQNIAVKYTAGWTLADMPEDVQEAVAQAVDLLYTQRTSDGSMKSEKLGDYSYTATELNAMNETFKDLVSAYRDRRF